MAELEKVTRLVTIEHFSTPPVEIIRLKRDGHALSETQISQLIKQYQNATLLDSQMAAFAMATCIQGMNADETYYLTKAVSYTHLTLPTKA